MGVCQNIPRLKKTMRNNIKDNNTYHYKFHKNVRTSIPSGYVNNQAMTRNYLESDYISKISSLYTYNNKYESGLSNISSNSTCVQTAPINKPQFFTIEATLGEIEVPIIVDRKENIIIKTNQKNENNNNIRITDNMWSFLKNEKPVDYLGYNNHKYKNINLGALHMRISGSPKVYNLNKLENNIICNDKGHILFYANLDINNYMIYEPKGSITISIVGGKYCYDNELLYYSYSINSFANKNKIDLNSKEYKILDYINKARTNLKKFYYDYYSNNDIITNELKEFIFKNYKNKVKELKMNKELNDLAEKHCEDLCDNETSGDTGTEGQGLRDRFNLYFKCYYFGENIVYYLNNPLLIVKNMIQDKYSKKKKNRNNLFSNKFNQIGLSLKEHPIYNFCCVVVFSE